MTYLEQYGRAKLEKLIDTFKNKKSCDCDEEMSQLIVSILEDYLEQYEDMN